mgnify:CR=1 FL=1
MTIPVTPNPYMSRAPMEGWQYGVMFMDGSVARRWNGNTQERLAREYVAECQHQYLNDNIRLVRRWVGSWEPSPDREKGPYAD